VSKKAKLQFKPLPDRIAKARREKRTQQALELTRELYKHERTDAHRELLRQVTLERGFDLQTSGKEKDAATVFTTALELSSTPETQFIAIRGLISCGVIAPALAALDTIGDTGLRQKAMNHVVDVALSKGPSGKALLPEPLHEHYDLIVHAFQAYENGKDDDARAALQNIGLQSPFLEWKVFLRGMMAYQTNDDVRALENWQRLDSTRLPANVCAPMRASIDAPYMNAQNPPTQQFLRTQLMKGQGVTCAPVLRELRELLHQENLAPAFRKVELILPGLRRDFPDVAKRLTNLFFWAIINDGHPEDLDRFARVFGFPPDDPHLHRLQALATETRGLWPEAHASWQEFIRDVGDSPQIWPAEVGKRVQALIWSRMAENAGPHRRRGSGVNPLFEILSERTATLKPGPEQCLEKAIKLAPDRIESQRALFDLYRDDDKLAKAKKLAQQMLKRFPDDFETLEDLAGVCVDSQEYEEAVDYLEKAIQANPLERKLPGFLALIRQRWGLQLTLDANYVEARNQYEMALKTWPGARTPLLCQWAMCELKAKNEARADELIAQGLSAPDQRLACRFSLVGESIRAKLPPAEKKRFAADFKAALAEPRTPAEIIVLIQSAAQQHLVHDEAFHGQKTQEKSIVKFFDQIDFNAFDETQCTVLTAALQTLEARKAWLNCLNYARRKYLKNPHFRLSFVEYYLTENTGDPKTHLAREHLDAARRLANDLPRGELQQQLLEEIQHKEEVTAALEARNRGMMDVFDRVFGGGPFGDDYDDDDDYY
jgi:tetratricopeptide (TPR) repeat protein